MDTHLDSIEGRRLETDSRAALTLIDMTVVVLVTTLVISVLLVALWRPSGTQGRLPGAAQVSSVNGRSPETPSRPDGQETQAAMDSASVIPLLGDARATGSLSPFPPADFETTALGH